MNTPRTLAALAAAAVLSLGATAPVHADDADDTAAAPCAKQEQQVARAEQALAHVTEVFAAQQTKVEKLEERLAAATTAEEQEKIQAKLDKALAKEQKAKKAKKAQLKRLAKAEERLAACETAHA